MPSTSDTKTITQKEYIPAKAGDIYKAFTDPQLHAAFTKAEATGEPRVGGQFSAWNGQISAMYIELQPGKKFRQEWKVTGWPKDAPPSIVEFTFQPKGEGTEVTLVQSRVPPDQVEPLTAGWVKYYWDPLKAYFSKK